MDAPLPANTNDSMRAESLSELLRWDDEEFVRRAYVTVLGRQADPEGESYYAQQLRNGSSKFQLLWQMRRSPEGAANDIGIPDFDHALKVEAAAAGVELPREQNPDLAAVTLPELLSWDDAPFVRCAFVTMLGRQADPSGQAFYSKLIRNGRSKMHVLWQLRRSAEGRAHDPGVAGLDRALKKAAWRRNIFVGWLLAPFIGGESGGAAARRDRAMWNEFARLRMQVASVDATHRLASIESAVAQQAHAIAALRNTVARSGTTSSRAGPLRNPQADDWADAPKRVRRLSSVGRRFYLQFVR